MQLVRDPDASAFLDRTEAYLLQREAENNVILGFATRARDRGGPDDDAYLAVTDGPGVVLAALRLSEDRLLISALAAGTDPARPIEMLATALVDSDPGLDAVESEATLAAAFARRWTAMTGRAARLEFGERLYELSRVSPPRHPAAGTWREATPDDSPLLAEWLIAFVQEALPSSGPADDPVAFAARWMAAPGTTPYLWTVDGEPVSMAAARAPTPHGIRISAVYTPPELRGRGYATALVAAASQQQLDAGRRAVFLFADRANPTSNRIYASIGYAPVCGVDRYRFSGGGA